MGDPNNASHHQSLATPTSARVSPECNIRNDLLLGLRESNDHTYEELNICKNSFVDHTYANLTYQENVFRRKCSEYIKSSSGLSDRYEEDIYEDICCFQCNQCVNDNSRKNCVSHKKTVRRRRNLGDLINSLRRQRSCPKTPIKPAAEVSSKNKRIISLLRNDLKFRNPDTSGEIPLLVSKPSTNEVGLSVLDWMTSLRFQRSDDDELKWIGGAVSLRQQLPVRDDVEEEDVHFFVKPIPSRSFEERLYGLPKRLSRPAATRETLELNVSVGIFKSEFTINRSLEKERDYGVRRVKINCLNEKQNILLQENSVIPVVDGETDVECYRAPERESVINVGAIRQINTSAAGKETVIALRPIEALSQFCYMKASDELGGIWVVGKFKSVVRFYVHRPLFCLALVHMHYHHLKKIISENRSLIREHRRELNIKTASITELLMKVLNVVESQSGKAFSEAVYDHKPIMSHRDSNKDIRQRLAKDLDKAPEYTLHECREDIYQPIWTFRTMGIGRECSSDTFDGSYNANDFAEIGDTVEWEIAEEFEFGYGPSQVSKTGEESPIQTATDSLNDKYKQEPCSSPVCIFYDPVDSTKNSIIYNYKRSRFCKNFMEDNLDEDESIDLHSIIPTYLQSNVINLKKRTEIITTSTINLSNYVSADESVVAWKCMLQDPWYAEDEEDAIMSVEPSLALERPRYANAKRSPTSLTTCVEDQTKTQSNLKKYKVNKNASSLEAPVMEIYKQYGSEENIAKSKSTSSISMNSSSPKKSPRFLRFRQNTRDAVAPKLEKQRTVIFGGDLNTLKLDPETGVPKFVFQCIKAIESEDNLKTHGLYRASGSKTHIEAVKKRMNDRINLRRDNIWQFLEKQDVHTLTGSLKLFFRSLHVQLIPDELFEEILRLESTESCLKSMRDLIGKLDETQKSTIKYLIKHLLLITDYKAHNLMDSSNLSICWGACLFASSAQALDSLENGNIVRINAFLKLMIDHFEELFL